MCDEPLRELRPFDKERPNRREMMIKYQTRSESTGIKNHESFENAIKAAVDDDTIWKVSYSNLNGKRIRFVR